MVYSFSVLTSFTYHAGLSIRLLTRVRFFVTRRYSFSSNLFFFLSRTTALPSFFTSRFFSSRYAVPGFRFRRFGLHLPSLFTRCRRLGILLSAYRLGRPVVRVPTYGYRTRRVFFFRRRLFSGIDRVYSKLSLTNSHRCAVFFPTQAAQSTQLWSTSWFTSSPTRLNLNTIPFLLLAPLHNCLSFFSTSWVLEFRRKVTRFLRVDFKKTVIQYNLKPILFRKTWLLGNRSVL